MKFTDCQFIFHNVCHFFIYSKCPLENNMPTDKDSYGDVEYFKTDSEEDTSTKQSFSSQTGTTSLSISVLERRKTKGKHGQNS